MILLTIGPRFDKTFVFCLKQRHILYKKQADIDSSITFSTYSIFPKLIIAPFRTHQAPTFGAKNYGFVFFYSYL